MNHQTRGLAFFTFALVAIALSLYKLELPRSAIVFENLSIGTTPATHWQLADRHSADAAPIVIIAHGFAGSRQLMNSFSLNLALAGYEVLAFDFEGHGRNPVPMSGDVTSIDGTTRLLVEETRRVVAAARELRGGDVRIALLGHSMATDVLLRAAIAELNAGKPVDTIVGISMFSTVITDKLPDSLLIINGQWEGRLRAPALAQLRLIDPLAQEGDTVRGSGVIRRVVVAPFVEHVSVLYSAEALRETVDWMAMTFSMDHQLRLVSPGVWILLLLAGIVLIFRSIVRFLPSPERSHVVLSSKTFLMAVLVPAFLTPLIVFLPAVSFLPVLVADYLMVHLLVFAILQLCFIRNALTLSVRECLAGSSVWISALALIFWGIAVFGFALDRYAASFLPTSGRLTIVLVLSLGTILFMIADSLVTGAGHAPLWRRLLARLSFFISLGIAAGIDPDRLIFLLLILPILVLFYLIYGLMGRWVAQRSGSVAAGVGLGLCLAWALGVSFPLFVA